MAAPVIDDFGDIRADVREQAKEKAKNALREKNKHEFICDLTIVGNTRMMAGVTFMVEGFGENDGKYIAESTTHTLDGGYTTKIRGRRVLEGY
jgi:hypothetical protein